MATPEQRAELQRRFARECMIDGPTEEHPVFLYRKETTIGQEYRKFLAKKSSIDAFILSNPFP
jgi:hypothetical protein